MGFINLWEYFGIEDITEKSHLDPKKNLPLNMNNGKPNGKPILLLWR